MHFVLMDVLFFSLANFFGKLLKDQASFVRVFFYHSCIPFFFLLVNFLGIISAHGLMLSSQTMQLLVSLV
jgi:hypothetical protein